jgi:phytanoyl-CoA hydroxylase
VSAALHDEDPEFSKFSRKPEMEKVARELIGFQNPLLIQSMYIFKQPRIGGEGNTTHTTHTTHDARRTGL